VIRPALRLGETVLLLTALSAGALGLATIAMVKLGSVPADALRGLLLFVPAIILLHVLLSLRAPQADQVILPVAAMLTVIGLITMQRLSWEPALGATGKGLPGRQIGWVLIGLLLAAAVVFYPQLLRRLKMYRYVWLLGGLALVAAALVLGKDITGTGARLWIGVGQWSFQPSELLKVLMVAFLASYMDERSELLSSSTLRVGPLRLPPLPYLLPMLMVWGISMAALVLQQDLGVAALFFSVFLAMLYMGTGRAGYVIFGVALFALGAVLAYGAVSHAQVRVAVWLNPWADPAGHGYQTIQTLYALASGGIFGVGLGYGQPALVPAVHTDLPLAALGEEIGLAGLLAIAGLYLVLVVRGLHIALHAADGFNALLAAGLSLALGIQSFLIIGGTLRVLPLTGITLPFISYGGSSLVTNYIIIGLLLRVSMERRI
jgi:cell division protein FtsW (lipid II flippase)